MVGESVGVVGLLGVLRGGVREIVLWGCWGRVEVNGWMVKKTRELWRGGVEGNVGERREVGVLEMLEAVVMKEMRVKGTEERGGWGGISGAWPDKRDFLPAVKGYPVRNP